MVSELSQHSFIHLKQQCTNDVVSGFNLF